MEFRLKLLVSFHGIKGPTGIGIPSNRKQKKIVRVGHQAHCTAGVQKLFTEESNDTIMR